MTEKELAYWGSPVYPVTVTVNEDFAHPIGWQEGETFHPVVDIPIGREYFDPWERQWMTVVWHGGKASRRGTTKGRLLVEEWT